MATPHYWTYDVPASRFELEGMVLIKKDGRGWNSTKVCYRKWTSQFGACPCVCESVWSRLRLIVTPPEGVKPVHLLWTLVFLKTHATKATLGIPFGGMHEETVRKWVWFFVDGVAQLESMVVRRVPHNYPIDCHSDSHFL